MFSSNLWWIEDENLNSLLNFFWMNIFGLDLIVILIEKHSIRAILTFSTNLTLCDSSIFLSFYFPCVSQFHWSPVKIILAWIIEIVRQQNYYMYYFLVFLSFLFIHCFVFILPISTILFVKFHLFVFLFIIFSSSFCKNDVSTTSTFLFSSFLFNYYWNSTFYFSISSNPEFSSLFFKLFFFYFVFSNTSISITTSKLSCYK